jgi:hypothetical protein
VAQAGSAATRRTGSFEEVGDGVFEVALVERAMPGDDVAHAL